VIPPGSGDDEEQQATAASLATFAQEETARRLQAQLDAQFKQLQAQAQFALQSRQQVAALKSQLHAQKASSQRQGGKEINAKSKQHPAPTSAAVQQQGTSALDTILNGLAGGKPGVQTALVIWNDAGKKRIEQALRTLDAVAFKAVHSMTKLDGGTPSARFNVYAFPKDVPLVQQLLVPLVAAGMRAEFHDSMAPSSAPSWSTVAVGRKPKASKSSKLAGQAQAGLSKAIGKAGPAGTMKRVHGQCDYYSAKLDCHRGAACHFTCYNGPGAP
jgi:hypothetical protein